MKNKLSLACVLGLALPAGAVELPSVESFRQSIGGVDAIEAPAAGSTLRRAPASAVCPLADMNGASVEGRAFSSKYDVKLEKQSLGTIEPVKNGYVFVDAQGAVVAKMTLKDTKDGALGVITDCAGSKFGEIVRKDTSYDGDKSFELRDASGASVMTTGEVEYLADEIVFKDGSGNVVGLVKDTGSLFKDRDTIILKSSKADPRLMAMTLMVNKSSDRQESSRRRMERPGRGDRY